MQCGRACSLAVSRDTAAASRRASSVCAASSAPPLPSGWSPPNRRALMPEVVGVSRDLARESPFRCYAN